MHRCVCYNPNVRGNNTILFKEECADDLVTTWPDGEVPYRLNNFTGDIDSEARQLRAVTVALRVWQLRINKIRFRRERNPDVSVDFDVSFEPGDHFSSDGVLAHAFYPRNGDVHINDNWNWVTHSALQDIGHPPIVPVMIHEFGHSLGLTHDTVESTSIMYPSFNLGTKKNSLHERDVNRIQELYGVRSLSQRIIDYFKRRRNLGIDFR